jgi:hypothetical protein
MRNGAEGGKDCTAGPRRDFAKEWERGKSVKMGVGLMSSESPTITANGGVGVSCNYQGAAWEVL